MGACPSLVPLGPDLVRGRQGERTDRTSRSEGGHGASGRWALPGPRAAGQGALDALCSGPGLAGSAGAPWACAVHPAPPPASAPWGQVVSCDLVDVPGPHRGTLSAAQGFRWAWAGPHWGGGSGHPPAPAPRVPLPGRAWPPVLTGSQAGSGAWPGILLRWCSEPEVPLVPPQSAEPSRAGVSVEHRQPLRAGEATVFLWPGRWAHWARGTMDGHRARVRVPGVFGVSAAKGWTRGFSDALRNLLFTCVFLRIHWRCSQS